MWDRQAFGWIGVAGVVAALLGLASLLFHPGRGVVFVPAGVLLVVGAVGGTVARRREGDRPLPLRNVAVAALTCTGLTLVLAYAYSSQQDGSCDTPTAHSFWTGLTGWGAVFTASCAFLLGLVGLSARRWFVALVCVFVNPTALLWMVASSGAFC
ncbi:MAG: hypothetical protein E6G26_12765 [Actinobacteria bacterium]|nr:MAG: hypothetical protein E6G26_12765 [Actinomycetota bacterium]